MIITEVTKRNTLPVKYIVNLYANEDALTPLSTHIFNKKIHAEQGAIDFKEMYEALRRDW